MKKILLLILIIFSFNCSGQEKTKEIILSGSIIEKDSNFILIPRLTILNEKINIKLPKIIGYSDREGADCKMYLQKELKRVYQNVSVDFLSQDAYNDNFKKRNFGFKDALADSVNLSFKFPFEIGRYRLMMQLKYSIENEEQTLESDWIYFNVPYIPKDALFY